MLIPLDSLFENHIHTPVWGVVHVGAHTGEEHDAYLQNGITDVLWIEGDPNTYHKLWKRLRKVDSYRFVNAVVTDVDRQQVNFNVANNEESSSVLEFGTHAKEHPTVKYVNQQSLESRTLDSLMLEQWLNGEYKYYNFLNVDVQGAELMVLKGGIDTLKEMDYIYLEVNAKELYIGCPLIKDLDEFLVDFDRVETSMTIHGWGDAFYVRRDIG